MDARQIIAVGLIPAILVLHAILVYTVPIWGTARVLGVVWRVALLIGVAALVWCGGRAWSSRRTEQRALPRPWQFNLTRLLVGMTIVATVSGLVAAPLYRARELRRGNLALAAENIVSRTFGTYRDYQELGRNFVLDIQPVDKTARRWPFWLKPFSGNAHQLPLDAEIQEIELRNDEQVAAWAQHAHRFANLQQITLRGMVTPGALSLLASNISRTPRVWNVNILTSDTPPGWYAQLLQIRALTIDMYPGSNYDFTMAAQELATLPNLEVLMINCGSLDDTDLEILAKSSTLQHLVIWGDNQVTIPRKSTWRPPDNPQLEIHVE